MMCSAGLFCLHHMPIGQVRLYSRRDFFIRPRNPTRVCTFVQSSIIQFIKLPVKFILSRGASVPSSRPLVLPYNTFVWFTYSAVQFRHSTTYVGILDCTMSLNLSRFIIHVKIIRYKSKIIPQ